MGEVSYRPLLEDKVWSYSSISTYDDCPYKFFLKYIKAYKEDDMFYASYGSFMHKLIENFYRGLMTKQEMLDAFLTGFSTCVKGERPKQTIVENYIHCGVEYLSGFEPFPYKMVAVEKKIRFKVNGIEMVVIIDYIGEKDGELYIVDNKSRNLKPRRADGKRTKNDEDLDHMLRQLYLYAEAVRQEYGRLPKALCFNCFKNKTFIVEAFNEDAFRATLDWATGRVNVILDADDFYPNWEFFSCTYICGVSRHCCYDESERRWRKNR